MGAHPTIRRFIWAICLTVAVLGARSASAAVPMCGDSAASMIAPTPVLPIRDVQIDAGSPLPCEIPVLAMAPLGARASGDSVIVDDAARESWIRPKRDALPNTASVRCPAPCEIFLPRSPGFALGVFRPPRA